jgi:TatD DNase family protein
MRLVDSHCHLNMLDLAPYNNDLQGVIDQASAAGVGHMLCVSVELKTIPTILAISERFTNVSASIGVHPNDSKDEPVTVQQLVELAQHPKVVAIGETGLDYFRSEGDLEWQRDAFRTHIRAAKELAKPLIIHTRDAKEDTLKILREENATEVGGVFHCFTEDWDTALAAIDLGFYISFSGIVTFKNAVELQNVAKLMPLERMLVETDSPYLAPVPYRGKTNYPAYVKEVAQFVAQLRNESFLTIAEQTTANYFNLFRPCP